MPFCRDFIQATNRGIVVVSILVGPFVSFILFANRFLECRISAVRAYAGQVKWRIFCNPMQRTLLQGFCRA
jgi:hypothetical protein